MRTPTVIIWKKVCRIIFFSNLVKRNVESPMNDAIVKLAALSLKNAALDKQNAELVGFLKKKWNKKLEAEHF